MSEAAPAEPGWVARWAGRAGRLVRELLVLAVLLGVSLGVFGWLRAPDLPAAAPPFRLTQLDGRTLELEALRGRVVVLNFWATWCGPCLAEIPTLQAFAEAHPDVEVVGVAVDEPGPVRARVERSAITYTMVIADRPTVEAYGVTTFPTTVVVDPEGRVRGAHTGLMLRIHLEALAAWAAW